MTMKTILNLDLESPNSANCSVPSFILVGHNSDLSLIVSTDSSFSSLIRHKPGWTCFLPLAERAFRMLSPSTVPLIISELLHSRAHPRRNIDYLKFYPTRKVAHVHLTWGQVIPRSMYVTIRHGTFNTYGRLNIKRYPGRYGYVPAADEKLNVTSLQGSSEGIIKSQTRRSWNCCSTTAMFSLWRNLNVTRSVISPTCSGTAADFFSLKPRQTFAPSRKSSGKRYNVPPSAEFVARVSGIPTMAKLPFQESADGLDAAFVGVPIDTGTSNRPGGRWCFSLQLLFMSVVLGRCFCCQWVHIIDKW